jgi:hypothetical protein
VDPTLRLVNCLMLAAAVVVAAYAPARERRAAVICAASLYPIWVLYSLSWVPGFQPHKLLAGWGLPIAYQDLWATYDLLGGALVLFVAHRFWWGRAVFASFLFESVLHWLRWTAGLVGEEAYYQILDLNFYTQIAVYLTIGGRGCGQHIAGILERLGRRRVSVGGLLAPKSGIAND